MSEYTKIRHIRDRKNPSRVMTIVTKVENGQVTFATAINSPPRTYAEYLGEGLVRIREVTGDSFSKKRGAQIAHARLENARSRMTVTVEDGSHPYLTTLRALASDTRNPLAARLAKDAILSFFASVGSEEKAACA